MLSLLLPPSIQRGSRFHLLLGLIFSFFTCWLLLTPFLIPQTSHVVAQSVTTHRVQRGETLSAIAGRYGVSLSALIQANNIANPNNIRVGQVLQIPMRVAAGQAATMPTPSPLTDSSQGHLVTAPAGSTASVMSPATPRTKTYVSISCSPGTGERSYTVQPGDTLSGLARSFGATANSIQRRNGLSSTLIRVGQCLVIPSLRYAPAAPATSSLAPTLAPDRRRYSEHPTATDAPTIQAWPTAAPPPVTTATPAG